MSRQVPDALFFLGVLFAVGGLERVGLLKEFAVQLTNLVPYDARPGCWVHGVGGGVCWFGCSLPPVLAFVVLWVVGGGCWFRSGWFRRGWFRVGLGFCDIRSVCERFLGVGLGVGV